MLNLITGMNPADSADWEWEDSLRYTNNVGESATWRLNLTAAQAAAEVIMSMPGLMTGWQ